MVLLNRLEKFAADRRYFSELQFGFREGVGYTEASFTILETINRSRGEARFSVVFSMFEKLSIQYGLTGYFTNYLVI